MNIISKLFQETFMQESVPDFVRKIYLLLESSQFADIICWCQDGLGLRIKNPRRLASEVLPRMFHQNTLRSFIRQLNMYDFKKIRCRQSSSQLTFAHPHMIRGNIEELVLIKRKKRGYLEEEILRQKEAKVAYDKYSIFVYGILTKISHNLGISKSLSLPSELPKLIKEVQSYCHDKVETSTRVEEYNKIELDTFVGRGLKFCDDSEDEERSKIPVFPSCQSLFDEMGL